MSFTVLLLHNLRMLLPMRIEELYGGVFVEAGEETVVNVDGSAELFFTPQSSPSALKDEEIALYTRGQPYWDIDSAAISQKIKRA